MEKRKNTSNPSSMEKLKQRKLTDKDKHSQKNDTVSKTTSTNSNNSSSSSGGSVLPEFHIGVFKDLGSADSSKREIAAKTLVTELKEIQNVYEKLENKNEVEDDAKLEAEKDDGLDNCAPSVRYAVRRLIRGVSSSRECARQGFALGLTVLVGTVPSIKMESLLKLIISLLEVSSSMKGQEAKDCLLGRLFAYGALARSGKLTEEWSLNKNTPFIREFTSCVISLGAKKRYLQEPAVAIILEMVGKLPAETLKINILEAPGLQEWLEGATEVGNPDALLLALKLQEKIGDDNKFGKLLPSPYSKGNFFSADHLAVISGCLKESTFCQPRLHSVWPVLVNNLLPDIAQDLDSAQINSIKKHKKARKSGYAEEGLERDLRCFFQVIIEGSLLPSSHDRKKLVFDVLLLLLPKLPASCVQIVLSYKIVQCLMDILQTNKSWLHNVAHNFIKELSEWATHEDLRRVEVIVALQKHSDGKFDGITRLKTVKDLMSDFKTDTGCLLFVQNLISMFLDEGNASDEPSDQSQTTDENSDIGSIEDKDVLGQTNSDFLKTWVVEILPNVSKHLKLDQDAKFCVQKEVLKFLAVQGLFSSSLGTEVTSFELQEKFRWPKSLIPSALCQMCIEQLQLLLANVQRGEGAHALSSGVEANDLGSYFMRFIGILRNIPSVSLSRTLSADDENAFKKLQAMESQLSREERNSGLSVDASKLHALRYLLIQLLLQILLRPGEFHEAASELVMCCKKAFGSSGLLDSSEEEDVPDEDGSPQLMDVLVDTMLSLLPNSSAPLRSAVEQVFKYFCEEVTDDGLVRMLKVIKKDLKPARRQMTDSVEDDSDDDILGVEEESDSDELEAGETVDNDEQTDDSEAVGGVEAVTAEVPEGSDDESDGGLDDEAMFRIDQKLATMVRERTNKGGAETAQSQLDLFKLRVLSLLEIFLHENPGKAQVLTVFSSLAQVYANPHTTEGSKQLGQRIWAIIQKKIFKAKDYPRTEDVDITLLESLLEKNLKLAAKPFKGKRFLSNPSEKKHVSNPPDKKLSNSWNRHTMITSLAQNSTYWILKIVHARKFSEAELQRVYDIMKNVLTTYFDSKKSQLKSGFLKQVFIRQPWIGQYFFGFLLEKCSNGKSQFRQVEALDLVTEILKPFISSNNESASDLSKMLKRHIPQLSQLIKHFVTNMPEKPARRAEVRKFCGKVFQIIRNFNMNSKFLKALDVDCHAACESQLGGVFLALKKKDAEA